MKRMLTGIVGAITILIAIGVVQAQDLRDQYGTRSLEAATQLDQGIKLVQQSRAQDALPRLEAAIKADADLQLAYYWKGSAHVEVGQIDEAIQSYEQMVSTAERTRVSNVTVDGCINLALLFAKLDDEAKASHWFSRSIMLDPTDRHKLQWKAYRNMAIGLRLQGDYDSAAMCAIHGYLANPQRVDFRMVLDFMEKSSDEGDVIQVLHFPEQPPATNGRSGSASLTEVDHSSTFSEPITDLLLDTRRNVVIALSRGQQQWYAIQLDGGLKVSTGKAAGRIACATVVDGDFYICLESPPQLQKVDPVTSKVEKTWDLPGNVPTSIAVVPVQDVAFFADRRMLQRLDLLNGRVTSTEYYSDGVASDPLQKFCYSFIRDEGESGHVLVDGRPIRFSIRDRWMQTSLSQYAVAERDLVFAAVRMKSASNGRRLHVSPDGHWVSAIGGGGWRPTLSRNGTGYGMAVFASADLSRLQGFFETDAYPLGLAVNPVTGQVAAVRKDDATIHHLSKTGEPATLKGPFTGPAIWSSDGRSLYLATQDGLRVWQNSLSTDEERQSKQWLVDLADRAAKRRSSSAAAVSVKALDELKQFTPKQTRSDVLAMLKSAGEATGEVKPIEWLQFDEYQTDAELKAFFSKAVRDVTTPRNAGILKYRLEKLKPEHPDNPGIDFLLGMAGFFMNQFDKCVEHHVLAIRADRGRTNVSVEALRCMAHGYRREKKPLQAAYCMATVLRLDPANPGWRKEARPFFEEGPRTRSRRITWRRG